MGLQPEVLAALWWVSMVATGGCALTLLSRLAGVWMGCDLRFSAGRLLVVWVLLWSSAGGMAQSGGVVTVNVGGSGGCGGGSGGGCSIL